MGEERLGTPPGLRGQDGAARGPALHRPAVRHRGAGHHEAPARDPARGRGAELGSYTFHKPLPDKPISGRDLVKRMIERPARAAVHHVTPWARGCCSMLIPIAMNRMLGQIARCPPATVGTLFLSLVASIWASRCSTWRGPYPVPGGGPLERLAPGSAGGRCLAMPVPFFRDNPVGELAGAPDHQRARAPDGGRPPSACWRACSDPVSHPARLLQLALALVAMAIMVLSLIYRDALRQRTVRRSARPRRPGAR